MKTITLRPNYIVKATRLAPNKTKNILFAFLLSKNKKEVIKLLKKTIELEPKNPYLYDNLADIYIMYNEYKKAEEVNKKAIELDKSFADAYYWIAGLYAYHIKDKDKAKYYFAKAIELQPEKDEPRDELADVINWERKTYISQININNIHGLKNKQIKIKEEKPAHLFITGDNGFFKTSILESVRDFMKSIVDLSIDELSDIEKLKNILFSDEQNINLIFNGNGLINSNFC